MNGQLSFDDSVPDPDDDGAPKPRSVPNPGDGSVERDEALERVLRGATDDEHRLVASALMRVIRRGYEFTSDDVWAELERIAPGFEVREKRLLGALMRVAAMDGLIETTGRSRKSTRPQHHRYPCQIWRPL
jgi:hypothetical protein